MTAFWLAIAVLIVIALGFMLFPIWRAHRHSGRWSWSAVVAVLVTLPIAFAVYYQIRTYKPEVMVKRQQEMALIQKLATRMQEHPDDVRGWRLLGRSYVAMGLYHRAIGAYQQAWDRTAKPDNTLKLDYAEATILTDRAALQGKAGKLVDEVVAAEPDNAKALWYSSQRALLLGREDTARAHLTHLLALGVPEHISAVVRQELAALPPATAGETVAAVSPTAKAARGVQVRIAVSLGKEFSAKDLKPGAALFIFARVPGAKVPVAVMREPVSSLPGEFVLSDANAMVPGRSLGDFAKLELVARVSPTDQAIQHAGDWYAESVFHPGKQSTASLVINKIVK